MRGLVRIQSPVDELKLNSGKGHQKVRQMGRTWATRRKRRKWKRILVLYILSFLTCLKVVCGWTENKKRGRIKKLDYKQTNKSTGTTSTAEWQRECNTRQGDKESTSEEKV